MPGPHGEYMANNQLDSIYRYPWYGLFVLDTFEHRIYNFCQGNEETTHGVDQSSSESKVKQKGSKSNMYLI